MAVWRRKALETFPELHHELHGTYGVTAREYNYYQCFFDLRRLFVDACEAGETPTLDRIFAFTCWCIGQGKRSGDLENAAVTALFEHIFDVPPSRIAFVMEYIQPEDVRQYWGLWEWFTPPSVWQLAAAMLADRFPDEVPNRIQDRLSAGKARCPLAHRPPRAYLAA